MSRISSCSIVPRENDFKMRPLSQRGQKRLVLVLFVFMARSPSFLLHFLWPLASHDLDF